MGDISKQEIINYIQKNISSFHNRRLDSLETVKLNHLLKRKNPYLFKAKNINTAEELVKGLLDAHLSSQEEGIFGEFLEGLVIFINSKVYGGWKSGIRGIDLEFDKDNYRYIATIKSGPNWGNSGQRKNMIDAFNEARKILKTSGSNINAIAIEGCCYGKLNQKYEYREKGDYYTFRGQKFWDIISGKPELYTEIIEPFGHQAKVKNEKFYLEYAKVINKFTKSFLDEFCNTDGIIAWEKVVELNSAYKL